MPARRNHARATAQPPASQRQRRDRRSRTEIRRLKLPAGAEIGSVPVKNALVLAGGGVAGIAWELGVLRGLQDADAELAARVIAADLIIGTSAGSAVAAQVT